MSKNLFWIDTNSDGQKRGLKFREIKNIPSQFHVINYNLGIKKCRYNSIIH